ncbi:DUF1801 domain-containing protein [Candidatus Roizmanbacteria bacterium]|nr:DUF1801 domain-containing protein [Candidatus Roizmanbacteria bacterium]
MLEKLRELIKKWAPRGEECMSYGAPAFKLHGILVLYAAFKNHLGLYTYPHKLDQMVSLQYGRKKD